MNTIRTLMKSVLLIVSVTILFTYCKNQNEQQLGEVNPLSTPTDSLQAQVLPELTDAPKKNIDLNLFSLNLFYGENEPPAAFVSLSQLFDFNKNNDSLEIPYEYIKNQKNYSFKTLENINLDDVYRSRVLRKTKITEQDTLYCYNYGKNKMLSLPVSKLQLAAQLSPYTSEGEEISAYDYMIGFKIDSVILGSNPEEWYDAFVTIGNKNHFVPNSVKLLKWSAIREDQFFAHQCLNKDILPENIDASKTKVYEAVTDEHHYYLKDFGDSEGANYRHLVVLSKDKKEFILDHIYTESDGTSFTPVNDKENQYQWAGRLLGNQPPVTFGYMFVSFGCPVITPVSKTIGYIEILCDNRH